MMKPSQEVERLIEIMAALRDPDAGCPWDLRQTFETIAPYTIEEAYEVADAIDRGDMVSLVDELGDLLLQVVYHARIAEEAGAFAFGDVVLAITDKMIRRHPHVFGDASADGFSERSWEASKAAERARRSDGKSEASLVDDVPLALPALSRAEKLQRRAARVGFDWPSSASAIDKIREEATELAAEIDRGDQDAIAEEIGDLLFSVVNVARHAKVDAEEAMRQANRKFVRRFKHVEDDIRGAGKSIENVGLAELDAAWERAKLAERSG